jgi:prolycopene isomerase
MHSEPGKDAYDAVVIGSGMGGMTSAALLAKAGLSTLVAEAQPGPGGFAHSFRRGPYTFCPAGHIVGDRQIFEALLQYLGVEDRCEFIPLDRFYTGILPGLRMDVPCGSDEFVNTYIQHFPHAADEIRRFVDVMVRMHHEGHEMPARVSLAELDSMVDRFPIVFKYRNATLQEVLDEYVTDDRVKSALGLTWIWLGLPPSRLSFFMFAQFLCSYMFGSFTCRGSFQTLIDALVYAFENSGGDLVVGNRVTRIVIEDGRVAGVELLTGEQIRSPVVVSNGDAYTTLEELVGPEHVPLPLMRRVRSLKPAGSGFLLLTATKLDLHQFDTGSQVLSLGSWDPEGAHQKILAGQPEAMIMALTTLHDPSLAPTGEHSIMNTMITPYDIGVPWNSVKERYTETVLEQMEAILPGFRENLTFMESATPEAMQRFSLNNKGAMYGWEMSPEQGGSKRPPQQTPIPGLYLAGHWTHPGGGILRSFTSGTITSSMVLNNLSVSSPRFEYAGLPPGT